MKFVQNFGISMIWAKDINSLMGLQSQGEFIRFHQIVFERNYWGRKCWPTQCYCHCDRGLQWRICWSSPAYL